MSPLEMKWNFASQNKAGVRIAKAGTLNNWCLTNFVVAFFLSLSKRNNAPVTLMTSIITVQKAIFLSAIHTILYVGVLYVRDASRPSPIKNKDYPSVIRARILAVAVAVLISVFLNRYVIENARNVGQRTGIPEWDAILGGWGEWKPDLKRTLNGFLLTALLFLGPLVEKFWIEEDWRYARADIQASMTSLTGWRNFIIGPVSEEIVFRGCIIPLFLMAGVRPLNVIFVTPLFFGLAHIHHAYEHNLHNPRSYGLTILVTLIQFSYTTVFGWYASYLIITTQTIWAPSVVHTFCNVMGLPRFWGSIPGVPSWKVVAYYMSLVVGAVGFIKYVGSLNRGIEL